LSKFGNIPTRVEGRFFHSKKEARRFQELRLLEQAGVISDLETQPHFRIEIDGVLICKVIPDFKYYDHERNQEVVEDIKSAGTVTQIFKLKKRLMKAVLGIEVEVVM